MKDFFKNNKTKVAIIIGVIILAIVVCTLAFGNKNENKTENSKRQEPQNLTQEVAQKNNKNETNYKKIATGAEILNEESMFTEYTFTTNNNLYIFDKDKLDEGIFTYEKVYDIPSNIKLLNIMPNYGADIMFVDTNDTVYKLYDENVDNKKAGTNYESFKMAQYRFEKSYLESYSELYIGKKMSYDFVSNELIVKDNKLYIHDYERPVNITEIKGNYEGEKIIRIYNEKILKTDKGFYEIYSYYTGNGQDTTTMKIELLSKYYDEVLTFTYKYVILKDYTLIPMKDLIPDYGENYYKTPRGEKPDSFVI
jgi:hypothetical protein